MKTFTNHLSGEIGLTQNSFPKLMDILNKDVIHKDVHVTDILFGVSLQPEEIDVLIGKDREGFFTSGLTLGNKKCSVIRDSLQIDGDWTMDIRTKSQGGEPTYNISVGRAGKGEPKDIQRFYFAYIIVVLQ